MKDQKTKKESYTKRSTLLRIMRYTVTPQKSIHYHHSTPKYRFSSAFETYRIARSQKQKTALIKPRTAHKLLRLTHPTFAFRFSLFPTCVYTDRQ